MSCSTLESGTLKPLSLSFQLQPPPHLLAGNTVVEMLKANPFKKEEKASKKD